MQGGRIGVVGVYAGFTNHFNIGAFMEKGLTMRAGQVSLLHMRICLCLSPVVGRPCLEVQQWRFEWLCAAICGNVH